MRNEMLTRWRSGHCFSVPGAPTVGNRFLFLTVLILAALGEIGCASSGARGYPDQAGAGIAEFRKLVVQLRGALEAALKSLDGVLVDADRDPRPAFTRFDEALHRLEVDSVQARARADAMRARGDAYFDEWEEQLRAAPDDGARQAASEQRLELRKRFEEIRRTAQQVREEFRPFLSDMRDLRIVLGNDLSLGGIDAAKPQILKTRTDGRRVEEALGGLIAEFNSVAATLQSRKPPKQP